MSDQQWYYESNGGQAGPISWDGLMVGLKMGKVTHETRVWSSHLTEWTSLGECIQKQSTAVLPPSANSHPSQSAKNRFTPLRVIGITIGALILLSIVVPAVSHQWGNAETKAFELRIDQADKIALSKMQEGNFLHPDMKNEYLIMELFKNEQDPFVRASILINYKNLGSEKNPILYYWWASSFVVSIPDSRLKKILIEIISQDSTNDRSPFGQEYIDQYKKMTPDEIISRFADKDQNFSKIVWGQSFSDLLAKYPSTDPNSLNQRR